MVRITLELLQNASQTLNPANQRQVLLRGLKIPNIENLGGTNDAYECIDLSDNDLSGTIPKELGGMTSLGKFDVANNDLEGYIPAEFGNLKRLSLDLVGNNFAQCTIRCTGSYHQREHNVNIRHIGQCFGPCDQHDDVDQLVMESGGEPITGVGISFLVLLSCLLH